MKNWLFPIACCLLLFACADSSSTTSEAEETATIAAPEIERSYCFVGAVGQDTVLLTFMLDGAIVTGDLAYNFYEKDRNTGTIEGELRGDTLFADYTFESEGLESVREVVFLKQDDNWVEGYGDMEEQNGKMVFTTPSSLTFGDGFILTKQECEE